MQGCPLMHRPKAVPPTFCKGVPNAIDPDDAGKACFPCHVLLRQQQCTEAELHKDLWDVLKGQLPVQTQVLVSVEIVLVSAGDQELPRDDTADRLRRSAAGMAGSAFKATSAVIVVQMESEDTLMPE